jgi:hypothetical protein
MISSAPQANDRTKGDLSLMLTPLIFPSPPKICSNVTHLSNAEWASEPHEKPARLSRMDY